MNIFVGGRAGRQHIAFSAYLDHVETGVQIDQIIKFNKVILNEGNDYSTATGDVFNAFFRFIF